MESEETSSNIDRKRHRIALVIGGSLLLVASIVLLLRSVHYSAIPSITEPQPLLIEPGSSFSSISNHLQARGIVENVGLLNLIARLSGSASMVQAGEYQILPGMSQSDLLALITSGETVQHRITFIEGWSLGQVLEALAQEETIEHSLNNVSDEQLLEILGSDRPSSEGLVHPDTYFYSRGTKDVDILLRAYRRQQSILETAWANRLGALPYDSSYEALIMASIIEKESGVSSEKGEIAGVFVRRLERGMRLQSDPTVIYGLGNRFEGDITREHLRETTAYNTYRIDGLPPSPIAIPSEESIIASLNPVEGDSLYFVATGDGGHYFSSSLEEHNAAVERFQRSATPERAND